MKKASSSLYLTLKNYISGEKHSFHTPGHKAGAAFDGKFRNFLRKNIFALDITVTPFVDSIHNPVGCLKNTADRIASLYGARKSFFLANGSTSGNLAAFLSLFSDGDSVLISRNVHTSVISACVISGIYPVWMAPRILPSGITCEVTSVEVLKYLKLYPEVKGVFITSPTYNGVITDVAQISDVCRRFGKILVVDEAWGPHLKFAGDGNLSAVNSADCVIHSFHKIFPVFSQGSILHVCSSSTDVDSVGNAVSLLTTTSPFYPMLLTIDYATEILEKRGKKNTEKMMSLGDYAVSRIRRLPFMRALDSSVLPENYGWDSSKITVDFREIGLTGFFVQNFLKKYGIGIDCATPLNIIAVLGFGNTEKDVDALVSAFKKLPHKKPIKFVNFRLPDTPPEIVLSPREVYTKHAKKKISLERAAGRISACTIAPYPPGIPVLFPGERITKEVIKYLKMIDRFRRSVFGYGKKTDDGLEFVSVIDV